MKGSDRKTILITRFTFHTSAVHISLLMPHKVNTVPVTGHEQYKYDALVILLMSTANSSYKVTARRQFGLWPRQSSRSFANFISWYHIVQCSKQNFWWHSDFDRPDTAVARTDATKAPPRLASPVFVNSSKYGSPRQTKYTHIKYKKPSCCWGGRLMATN